VKRTGAAKDVFAEHVFEHDEFEYAIVNGVTTMSHVPELGERGEYRFTYACIVRMDNSVSIARMDKKEIDAIRARSKAANNGPWVSDYLEMCKKTVIKRLLKTQVDDIEVCSLLAEDDNEYADAIEAIATPHVPKIAVKKKTLNIAQAPQDEPEPETNYSEPLISSSENKYHATFSTCKTIEDVELTKQHALEKDESLEIEPQFDTAYKSALTKAGAK